MPHNVWSLEQVAHFLRLGPRDVRGLVQREEIPFERKGDRLLFRRREVQAWASERLLGFSPPQLDAFNKSPTAGTEALPKGRAVVPELMKPAWISPELPAKTRASLLRQMVRLAERSGLLNFEDDLLASLVERERMCSTALAGGIALLHPRHHEPYLIEESFVVLGRSLQPIPFGAPDGATTDLFFLVCCGDDRTHLHVLARLCMLCHRAPLIEALREAADAEAMYDCLVRAEADVLRAG